MKKRTSIITSISIIVIIILVVISYFILISPKTQQNELNEKVKNIKAPSNYEFTYEYEVRATMVPAYQNSTGTITNGQLISFKSYSIQGPSGASEQENISCNNIEECKSINLYDENNFLEQIKEMINVTTEFNKSIENTSTCYEIKEGDIFKAGFNLKICFNEKNEIVYYEGDGWGRTSGWSEHWEIIE
jgi:hypothetical protein